MTEKSIDQITARVDAMLRDRNNSGATTSEIDFLAGAMTVINEIYGTDAVLPPRWVVPAMAGQPVFKDCPPPRMRPGYEDNSLVARLGRALRVLSQQPVGFAEVDDNVTRLTVLNLVPMIHQQTTTDLLEEFGALEDQRKVA